MAKKQVTFAIVFISMLKYEFQDILIIRIH